MIISVLVPTYRRPKDLERCLLALKQQTRPVDELLITVRDTDQETWAFLKSFNSCPLPIQVVTVNQPGLIAALNAGLKLFHGDIVSITDDDSQPYPNWLENIERHFLSDSNVGGVGGRDWVFNGKEFLKGQQHIVGRIEWYGRVIGNHHLGVGEPRHVDILKGVNSSYRRSAIKALRYDERLRSSASSTCCDMAMSLTIRKLGWKLIYDPKVAVNHYPGQRFFQADRKEFDFIVFKDTVYNETLITLEYLLPFKRLIFLIWAILIGTKKSRGILQCFRFLPLEHKVAILKLLASLQGRWEGFMTWRCCAR